MSTLKYLCAPLGVRFQFDKTCPRFQALAPRLCGQCGGPKKLVGKVPVRSKLKARARERVGALMG